MSIFFISDIHLNPEKPETYDRFRGYLESIRSDAEQLYILGDLFDYWIGDDGLDLLGHRPAVEILQELSKSGTNISVMHGNRDFLIGDNFIGHFNGTLISDPHIMMIAGQRVLLMHGDSLCTDDIQHQRYREIVLSPEWQEEILKLSLDERRNRAIDMRMQSKSGKILKNPEIMDVNQETVVKVMQEYDTQILIHGHVHRTALHELQVNGLKALRYVLGDWDSGKDGVIRIDSGCRINLYAPFD